MSIEKFSFPTPIHFGVGSRKLVGPHLKNLGFKRPLIVTDKAMADLPLMAEFISHLNGLEVSVYAGVHGNPTASQVTAGGAAFKAHTADCVIGLGGGASLDVAKVVGLANAGGDTVNSIKAAAEFGLTKKQNLAALLMLITDVHAIGLNTAQGLYLTEGWYWDLNPETRAWAQKYEAEMKKKPNSNHASVYSSTMHYLKAVQAAGTDDTAAVMKKMQETPINDMFAKNGKLRADGRMVHDMYLFQVKTPAESKGAWDYYNLKGTIKGDDAFQPLAQSRCAALKK